MIYTHKVQYYETDKMGIVHHSNYVRWMEEARVAFLEYIGASFVSLEDMGIVSPVLTIDCRFVDMTRFGDSVDITPKIEEFKGVKLLVEYEMRNSKTGEICFKAHSTHCFMQDGKVINMRKKYPEIYAKFSEEMEKDKINL